MALSVAAAWMVLYQIGVRDESVFLGAAGLVVLYEWVFLWN